jgi:hypothetical protein
MSWRLSVSQSANSDEEALLMNSYRATDVRLLPSLGDRAGRSLKTRNSPDDGAAPLLRTSRTSRERTPRKDPIHRPSLSLLLLKQL